MDASLMKRMKELEDENSHLKKMYIEEKLIANTKSDSIAESGH
jgi:putative transposase